MKKFEVCIRGTNFLIKSGSQVKQNGFYAARFIEANDSSEALESVMGAIKAELKDVVLNEKSNPPKVTVEDVYEVYYFGDKILWEGRNLPPEGFVWDEEVVSESAGSAASSSPNPLEGKLPTLWNRIQQKDIHIHSIFIHFTNSLYPVAILFMFLFLLFGNTSFHQTYFYIMVLATFSVPVSYLTGLLEWRKRFKGIMIPIFAAKIKYGVVVFIIGGCSTLWHYLSPSILVRGDILSVLFILLNISIMVPLIYLGHLGGIIVYEGLD
ncbi:MAG: hypothetical protein IT392_09525 [Nitrospirae bacterium]|nr:hypothetical protein [Nitrospirota bacterium]